MLGVLDGVSAKLVEQGDVLEQMQRKLADQDKVLFVLAASPPPAQGPVLGPDPEQKWTEIVKRVRAGQPKPRHISAAKTPVQNRAEKTGHLVRPPRSRPLAIVVSKGGEEFPELLKTIRRTVDP